MRRSKPLNINHAYPVKIFYWNPITLKKLMTRQMLQFIICVHILPRSSSLQ